MTSYGSNNGFLGIQVAGLKRTQKKKPTDSFRKKKFLGVKEMEGVGWTTSLSPTIP